MGEEGFSSDSSLLYHSRHPVGDGRRARVGAARPVAHRRTRRCCPGTCGCTTCSRARSTRPPTRSPDGGSCSATPTSGSPTSWPALTSPSTATRSATSASTSSRGAATVETVFGALPVGQGDYVILPRATTHRWLPHRATSRCARYAIEANSHIAPPKRYLSRYGQLLEHAPYCERDLHGPTEPLLVEGTDVEVLVKHRGTGPGGLTGTRYVVPTHPVRRRRLGRLPVPVHVQHRRLRADHRPGAPAPARAPGVRGHATS